MIDDETARAWQAGSDAAEAAEVQHSQVPASLVADVVINRRRVDGYTRIGGRLGNIDGCIPLAHAPDRIVGYVVRRTVEHGRELWHGHPGDSLRGYDVEVYEAGPGGWEIAHEAMLRYRHGEQSWAALDALYACGHRD